MDEQHRLPLGLCKQLFLKVESSIHDLEDIISDEDLTDDEKYEFQQMMEVQIMIGMRVLNSVKKEIDETDFVNEDIGMDSMESETYEDAGDPVTFDLLDEEI